MKCIALHALPAGKDDAGQAVEIAAGEIFDARAFGLAPADCQRLIALGAIRSAEAPPEPPKPVPAAPNKAAKPDEGSQQGGEDAPAQGAGESDAPADDEKPAAKGGKRTRSER